MKKIDKKVFERHKRLEIDYRRLQTRNPACPCGERNPAALTGIFPNIICYECLAKKEGRSTIEQNHVAGRHNNPIKTPLPGNPHRIITREQETDWPTETFRNPGKNTFLQDAAMIRGTLLLNKLLKGIPERIEWLNKHMQEKEGEDWWKNYPIPK